MDETEIMLKEYDTLRQESLDSMRNRNTILSFGLAAIGAIFTGSIIAYSADAYSLISSLALIIVIPLVSSFTLVIWLGEYERMQRAGRFLVELERRINEESSKKLLTWETRLREGRRHMRYPYYAAIALLIGISGVLFSIGIVMAGFCCVTLTFSAMTIGILVHVGLYLFASRRISKLRL